jgi:ABC-type bacteriocin/lantibiotic exporter with double-glycine peptidase domain
MVAEIDADAEADEDAGESSESSESSDDEGGTTRESVTVEHTLTYVEQSDDETCWAASTAMMLGRTDDREIVREVTGDDPSDDENDAVSEVELARVANHYGFSQVYPVCQDAFGWADWLAQGPLLIQVPGQTHHSVVAAGVYASADENVEESLLLIYDPWPGNGVRWLSFNDANNDYEMAGENWSNNVYRR